MTIKIDPAILSEGLLVSREKHTRRSWRDTLLLWLRQFTRKSNEYRWVVAKPDGTVLMYFDSWGVHYVDRSLQAQEFDAFKPRSG
jgi:hypothetical protein